MPANVIELIGLCKTFGGRKVIDDLSLTVEEGDVFGFLGQNGSGKTTTIRLMLNLIFPEKGIIKLNNYDIKQNFNKAIENVGAVVEIPKFYSYLSGRKNLQLMAKLIPKIGRNKVEEVLELVGLSKMGDYRVKTYSLGMKQRLGIANALLNNPKLVVLDEPTNGLDPQGMREIREMIKQLAETQNITFFISSHLLTEVEQICNKVAILQNGKIKVQGSVKELLNLELESIDIWTAECDKALCIMKDLSFVKSMKTSQNGVIVQIEKGNSTKLNQLLVTHGIGVEYLIPIHQRLEEFFIKLTEGDMSNDESIDQ